MTMKPINIYLIIAIVLAGCNQKQKKENFQYERVQENSSEVIQNIDLQNTVILNSNDAMLFDKKVIKVSNTIVSAKSFILIGIAACLPNANIHNGMPKKP